MQIAVAGIGYVGLANACLLAKRHPVVITDVLREKTDKINKGISPLEDADILEALASDMLNLTACPADNCDYSVFDYVIIATPTDYDGVTDHFNTTAVEDVIDAVIAVNSHAVICIRSTIPIGFTRQMNQRYSTDRIIFAPEFLREGRALFDAQHPSRIVVGGSAPYTASLAQLLAEASEKPDATVLLTNSAEAEAIKLFSNAYLAMRVAFINEVDTFSMAQRLDSKQIIEGISLDPRIGSGYNNPSFGYGGYCLPKDTKQLRQAFKGIPSSIIPAIVEANEKRKAYIAQTILEKSGTVGIYRLTMKSGSDNYRESSIIDVIKQLQQAGRKMLLYEPLADAEVFLGCTVVHDLARFKQDADIIVANRLTPELENVAGKVFTRDVFGEN